MKKQTAVRFSTDAQQLLAALVADTGLTQTKIMELAIRDLAKARRIKLRPPRPVQSHGTQDRGPEGADGLNTYQIANVAHFRKSKEPRGGLSNMAAGFPLTVNGHTIRTSEALYQMCKFPHFPETQELLLAQHSPIMLARIARAKARPPRPDWEAVKIDIMCWALHLKLAQNWETFGALLLATGDIDIVEESHRDAFWGAIPDADGKHLTGTNKLGKLLMELRHQLRTVPDTLQMVTPPDIPDLLLLGQAVGAVRCHGPNVNNEPNNDPEKVDS